MIIDALHALHSAAVVANLVPGVTLTVQLLCPGILWNQGYSVVVGWTGLKYSGHAKSLRHSYSQHFEHLAGSAGQFKSDSLCVS